jgi:hypothetical protein
MDAHTKISKPHHHLVETHPFHAIAHTADRTILLRNLPGVPLSIRDATPLPTCTPLSFASSCQCQCQCQCSRYLDRQDYLLFLYPLSLLLLPFGRLSFAFLHSPVRSFIHLFDSFFFFSFLFFTFFLRRVGLVIVISAGHSTPYRSLYYIPIATTY